MIDTYAADVEHRQPETAAEAEDYLSRVLLDDDERRDD